MDLDRVSAYVASLDAGNSPILENIERKARVGNIPVVRRDTQGLLKFLLATCRPRRILEVGTAVGFSALLMAEHNLVPCEITTIEQDAGRAAWARENFLKAESTDFPTTDVTSDGFQQAWLHESGTDDRHTKNNGQPYDRYVKICDDESIKENSEGESDIGEDCVGQDVYRYEACKCSITLIERDASDILPALAGSYGFIFMDAAKGQYLSFLSDVMRLLVPGGILVSDNVLYGGDILESRYAVTRRDRTIHKRMRDYLYALTHDARLVTTVLPVGDGVAVSTRVR